MNNYLNIIMQNHGQDSNSYDEIISMDNFVHEPKKSKSKKYKYNKYSGGGSSGGSSGRPTGGLPPIFICEEEMAKKMKDGEDKDRGYATKKSAVSLKDIMQQRRDNAPFI